MLFLKSHKHLLINLLTVAICCFVIKKLWFILYVNYYKANVVEAIVA